MRWKRIRWFKYIYFLIWNSGTLLPEILRCIPAYVYLFNFKPTRNFYTRRRYNSIFKIFFSIKCNITGSAKNVYQSHSNGKELCSIIWNVDGSAYSSLLLLFEHHQISYKPMLVWWKCSWNIIIKAKNRILLTVKNRVFLLLLCS